MITYDINNFTYLPYISYDWKDEYNIFLRLLKECNYYEDYKKYVVKNITNPLSTEKYNKIIFKLNEIISGELSSTSIQCHFFNSIINIKIEDKPKSVERQFVCRFAKISDNFVKFITGINRNYMIIEYNIEELDKLVLFLLSLHTVNLIEYYKSMNHIHTFNPLETIDIIYNFLECQLKQPI